MFTSIAFSIVAGVLAGFVVSSRTPTDGLEDLTRNVLSGTVGAFFGIQIVSNIFDSAEVGASAVTLTVASILGASITLFLTKRFRRA